MLFIDSRLENWVLGGEDTIKRVAFSFPGLIELLPTYPKCCIQGVPTDPARRPVDLLDFSLWTRYGWVPAVVQKAPGRPAFLRAAFQNGLEVFRLMEADLPPGVLQILVVGDLIDTKGQVYFRESDGKPVEWRTFGGDGTVPLPSSTRGNWVLAQAVSAKHATIFSDPRVGSNLKFALTEAVQQFRSEVAETYVTVAGQSVRVRSLDVRVSKPYYEAGSAAEVLVTLVDINGQPITGLSLQGNVLAGEMPVQSLTFNYSTAAPEGYRATITTPTAVGSYRVVVPIPGMQTPQEEFFSVLPQRQP